MNDEICHCNNVNGLIEHLSHEHIDSTSCLNISSLLSNAISYVNGTAAIKCSMFSNKTNKHINNK